MIANDTPKVPGQCWKKVIFDHLRLFWLVQEEDLLLVQEEDRGIFAAANAAATTRLSVGNEQVFRNLTPEKMTCIFLDFHCFFSFCAANAAATTRLSDGNEQVFRNLAPEK